MTVLPPARRSPAGNPAPLRTRAAFALHPARHLAMTVSSDAPLPASTPWHQAPPLAIQPRLRELGEAAPRGAAGDYQTLTVPMAICNALILTLACPDRPGITARVTGFAM